jgi:ABC-type phosphate transport system substrate-binding protein
MRSRFLKLPRARIVALALGVGALGSLATAPASFAAGAGPKPPAIGTNCQPDGKINGGGSTFQANAINDAFTFGFQQDVCGPQPQVTNLNASWGTTDPSVFSFGTGPTQVAGMVAYNVSLGGVAETNGSGAGLRRLSCRTDMFAGTDLPYNNTQLGTPGNGTVAGLDGPPGSESGGTAPQFNCDNGTLNTTAVPPPFGPQPSSGPWPATGDVPANAMSFPVAAGAVAVAVNLTGKCTVATPTGLNLTSAEFDQIWQGTINQWNDPALVATNPILATDNCSGNIQRVVRQDNSGTTAITMFTLNGIDQGALCGSDSGTNWYTIATGSSNAGLWPQGCVDGNSNTAPNPITAATSGSPALIALLDATPGGIGYAELGLWGTLPAGVSFANLQNSTATAFVSPGAPGSKSNCNLSATVPTGASALQAVGLGSPTWTNTGTPAAPGKQDVAFTGSGYPACGLTFDLVYSNESEAGEVAAPSTPPATPGCQITAPTPTATNGDQTLPEATVTVTSTAGFPASGTLSVGGQTVTYTGKTATTFTGAAGGSGLVTSGSAVSLVSTTAAATSTTPGVNGACQTVGGPLAGVTNNQLRTLYAYFTYLFSPLGQTISTALPAQTLDPLPATWLTALEQGYQQNF